MGHSDLSVIVKRAAKIFAGRLGLSLDRHVHKQDVLDLIRTLHPVKTDIELVRLGADADGGYLLPNDFDGIVACFSPGVDIVASFEHDLVARKIPCYLADASVSGPPFTDPLIHFQKKFLGVINDSLTMTMDEWFSTSGAPAGDIILQMDIEGAEWSVLQSASDAALDRCRIIAIEFHALDRMVDEFAYKIISNVFKRLLSKFYLVHNHPNNNLREHIAQGVAIPRDVEMTFLRRDRTAERGYAQIFPHPLDRKNAANQPEVVLPPEWYRKS